MVDTFGAEFSASGQRVERAGKTLVALSKNASRYMIKTGLLEEEQCILEDCFARGYGQEGFSMYHVESVWTAVETANTQLVHFLLAKDAPHKLLEDESDALQDLLCTMNYYTENRMAEVLEIAQLLFNHGARVDTFDAYGNTPIYYTCIYGHPQSFHFFKDCGADWTTMHSPACSEWPFVPEPELEKVNLLRVTVHALHTSFAGQRNFIAEAYARWIPIILSLVHTGFKVVFTDPGSATLLKVVCYDGHLDHLQTILEHSLVLDIEGRLAEEDAVNLAPGLHAAACRGHSAIVLYLLKLGVPPDLRCVYEFEDRKYYMTAIAAACAPKRRRGYETRCPEFIDACEPIFNAGVSERDGQLLLREATILKRLDVVRKILDLGVLPADVRLFDSAEIIESFSGNSNELVDVIQVFLDKDVNLNPATLQELAIKLDLPEILRWLVKEHHPVQPVSLHGLLSFDSTTREPGMNLLEYLVSAYSLQSPGSRKYHGGVSRYILCEAIRHSKFDVIRALLYRASRNKCPSLFLTALDLLKRQLGDGVDAMPNEKQVRILQLLFVHSGKACVSHKFDADKLWLTPSMLPSDLFEILAGKAKSTSPCRMGWCPRKPQSRQDHSSKPVSFGEQEREPSSDSPFSMDYAYENEPQRTYIPLPAPLSAAKTANFEFTYWDLNDPYEIRVLVLEPAPDIDAPVKCRLEPADLADNTTEYEALSYVWGNASDKVLIWVQNTHFPATRNLWEALCRLRLPDRPRTLWVDAVCINQANIEERNKQVQLMRHIYQSAKRTLIWVGEEADGSHLLYQHVSKWKQYCEENGVEPSIEDNDPPSYNKQTERAFLTFCHRPWFYRTWIIQEKALSEEAIVVCGQDAEEWSLLFHQEISSVANVMDVLQGVDGPTHLENLGLMGAAVTEEAIQHSRICESTDPKDKVYALLGLLKRPLITVDYKLSTETVYAMFTKAVIQQEKTLRILHLMGSHKRLQALPSWVPDFSILRPVDILPEPPHRYPTDASYALVNVSPCLRFSGFEMTLGGCKLDTIKSVADELPADEANYPGSAAFSETLRKWESLAIELQHHRSSRSICEAFHRTLRAQHGFGPLFDPEEHYSRYPPPPRWLAWYNSFGAGVLRSFHSEYFWELEVVIEWAGAAYQETEEVSDMEKYTTAIKQACYGRSFFITNNGSMGLAPPRAESGDFIVYLQGGVHPFVLRPDGKSGYSLIGDCYLDDFNEHDFTLEDIENFGEFTLR